MLFEVLHLKRSATEQEVATAYKKLALKYHPMKNSQQMRMYLPKFHEIAEAYEVLSNQQLRTIYENYGYQTLTQGIQGPDGVMRGGYQYQQNCYEIFEKFFLECNPFYDLCDAKGVELEGSLFGTAFGGMNEPPAAPLKDVHVTVNVTLREFFCGSQKSVSYEKQVVGLDGRTTHMQQASVDVIVKPGMLESQVLCFKGQGNQQPKQDSTDLIVKFKMVGGQCDHSKLFKRQGDYDLLYTHKCTLLDVIECKPVRMVTLDGRTLTIPIDQVMSPGTVKAVPGEGLLVDDITRDEKGIDKGCMFVLFDVEFPATLSRQQKDQIEAILTN